MNFADALNRKFTKMKKRRFKTHQEIGNEESSMVSEELSSDESLTMSQVQNVVK